MEGMAGLDQFTSTYSRRWSYFAGELPERFASERIRTLIERSASAYRFRLSRIPVEALANRISIASVTSSIGDRVSARIEEIRQANDMELQEPFVHERLFVYGDAYLFVWPVDEGEATIARDGERVDVAPDADTLAAGIELAYQSPLSCRAFYDAEDGRRVRYVIRRWRESWPLGKVWRVEVWYTDRLESWVSQPDSKGTDPEDWLPYAEDATGVSVPATSLNWPEPHDFGEIPIKHARTDLPYGNSVLEDFIGPQNLITKATATQASNIESHGWRERYTLADDAAVLDQARDAVNWDDSADAPSVLEGVTPVSGRRRGPGVEHHFTGTKAVGEFSAPDLSAMIEPMEQWVRFGASASSTPYAEFDPRFGASMSGIARQRADAPMRAKEKTHKRFLLRFWREVWECALRMDNIADPGEITVNWSPPEVIADPDWWSVATIRREHGVPQRKILEEANYTPEDLDEWEKDQKDSLLVDARIDRLVRLGEAMQTLGAGSALLGIPSDRIAKLVESILGDAGSPGALVLEDATPPPPVVVDPNAPPVNPNQPLNQPGKALPPNGPPL